MRKSFSRIIAFILAMIIFYNSSGFVVTFLFQQAAIRHVVTELLYLKKAPLVLLHFSKTDSSKILNQDTDEFYFHNVLYDVASIERNDNGVNVYCYQDVNENNLVHEFIILLKNHNTGNKNKNTNTQTLIFSDSHLTECPDAHSAAIPIQIVSRQIVLTGQSEPGLPVKPPENC